MSPTLDLFTKISVTVGLCATLYLVQLDQLDKIEKSSETVAAKTLDTSWRYTRLGWQDSANWEDRTKFPKPMFAEVHPFVWTALMLLAVLGLMVWSSNEVEVDSLVNPGQESCKDSFKNCDGCRKCENFCRNLMIPDQPQAAH